MKLLNLMIPLTMMALVLVDCKGDHNTDDNDGPPVIVERPDSIFIHVEKAKELFDNYEENRISLIENAENNDLPEGEEPYQATTSITFNYKKLQKYMTYIEQQAHESNTNIEGLRIYLGQYSNDDDERHPRAETVFFNPTMKKDGKEVAFAIQHQNGNNVAVPVGELLGHNGKPAGRSNLILKTLQDSIISLAGNQGHRRPPPKTGDDQDY